MGTIADKLSYLNDTKTLLRRGINALGGDLTTDDTFRSYVNALDNIYDYLPKVTGTGTSVTLDGVRDGGLRITLNPTALSQTTYTGKNKLAYTLAQLQTINTQGTWSNNVYTYNGITYTINSDLTVKTSGTANSTSSLILTNSLNLTTGTDYILNGCPSGGAYNTYSIRLYDGSEYSYDIGSGKSFTYGTQNLIRINFSNGTNASNLTFSPMVRLASVSDSTYEPYVGGTAAPNSQFPMDIHIISGDNSVVAEGKNLLNLPNGNYNSPNITGVVSNGTITLNGTAGSSNEFITIYLTLSWEEGQDYSISCFNATAKNVAFRITPSGVKDTNLTSANATKTFTNENITLFTDKIQIRIASGETLSNFSFKPMIIKGSTPATTYTPYVSQTNPINLGEYELGTIGNYSNEFVRSGGEQLFDKDNATRITAYISSDTTWEYGSDSYSYRIPCKPNTNYVISANNPNETIFRAGVTTSNDIPTSGGNYIVIYSTTRYANTNTPIYLTTGANAKYIVFQLSSANHSTTLNSVMINEGTTALPYVPYEKGWYYKQGIGKVVLDGTEYWRQGNDDGTRNYFFTPDYDNDIAVSDIGLCSHFVVNYRATGNCIVLKNTYGGIRIYIESDLGITDTTKLSQFLSSNNVIIYYIPTPTYTKITGELAEQLEQVNRGMLSYDGTTNISQVNNDLAFGLDITALKELEESEG